MKLLDGKEIQGYIKERQAKHVRRLKQSVGVEPKLVIINTANDSVSNLYTNLKKSYGEDIGVPVELIKADSNSIKSEIENAGNDKSVSGVIVQLPLEEGLDPEILNGINPDKDVDGLGENTKHTPATALAISWLLDGYNIDLNNSRIAIVGQGKLVGLPYSKLLSEQGVDHLTFDINSESMADELKDYDVVVTAVGKPGLITSHMIKNNAVVVDAGAAEVGGEIKGDAADDLRDREDITITPVKGGVGPLTVSALFENVIKSAESSASGS